MADTAFPTQANRGMLPVGTVLADGPFAGARITDVSFTAYKVAHVGLSAWLSFDQVHGRPAPVMPLVVLS